MAPQNSVSRAEEHPDSAHAYFGRSQEAEKVPSWSISSRVMSDQSSDDDLGVVPDPGVIKAPKSVCMLRSKKSAEARALKIGVLAETFQKKDSAITDRRELTTAASPGADAKFHEAMKSIMVVQEIDFKNQVEELHRLVQQQRLICQQVEFERGCYSSGASRPVLWSFPEETSAAAQQESSMRMDASMDADKGLLESISAKYNLPTPKRGRPRNYPSICGENPRTAFENVDSLKPNRHLSLDKSEIPFFAGNDNPRKIQSISRSASDSGLRRSRSDSMVAQRPSFDNSASYLAAAAHLQSIPPLQHQIPVSISPLCHPALPVPQMVQLYWPGNSPAGMPLMPTLPQQSAYSFGQYPLQSSFHQPSYPYPPNAWISSTCEMAPAFLHHSPELPNNPKSKPFKQPPPMVLVQEEGSRNLRLVSAEEHYGNRQREAQSMAADSKGNESNQSSDKQSNCSGDGDVIDPSKGDSGAKSTESKTGMADNGEMTKPKSSVVSPMRPVARRPDSSAGGKVQEMALRRVIQQLDEETKSS